jgi:hypothetical protein
MLSKEDILRLWHNSCQICRGVMGEERYLHEAIVELEVTPKHANKFYTQFYVVCPGCEAKGDLL